MRAFIKIEGVVLSALLVVFVAGGIWFARHSEAKRKALVVREWMQPGDRCAARALDERALAAAIEGAGQPSQSGRAEVRLLSSEVRVVAVGSGYPIPYDAATCPFSGIPQPKEDQLDRDGDAMTDSWESHFGLDRRVASDAGLDLDGDGFSNLEEFVAETDPSSDADHPPYILKMRFVKQMDVPFPLVFMGTVRLPDGRTVLQINRFYDGKTYFRSVGGRVNDISVERFTPRRQGKKSSVIVARDGVEIELPRGEKVPDPKSQGELINMLDSHLVIATVGALLSLRNDEYTVLDVCSDKVIVRFEKTGNVFEVVGFTEGERDLLSGGSKE